MHSLASAALVNDHDDIRNAFIDAQIHSQIQHFHSTLNGSDSGGGGGADVAVSDAGLYYGTFTDNALSASMYQYTMADFMDIPLPHNPLVDQTSHSDQSVLHHPSDGRRAVASAPRQLDYVVHSSPPHEQRAHDSHVPLESQRKCLFSVPLPSNGHTHTMLPPIVSPSAGGDPSAHFDTDGSFNQRIARAMDSSTDPCAAAFLQQQLGHEKWSVFSARLFERRLNHGKPKGTDLRAKRLSIDDNITKAGGASTIDFLVKVEVVKEVLRTYVPHPYNPLKSLMHQYAGSPTGHVTLTRSAILALSGWSNTQFSYWARRVEAVSVLAPHDERIRAVAEALKRRLSKQVAYSDQSSSSSSCTSTMTTPPGSPFQPDLPLDITGKGLDVIIEEVKKQTGQSQFLRGKHSSLDPFGSVHTEGPERGVGGGGGAGGGAAPVFNATFQAVAYTHSHPTAIRTTRGRQQKRRGKRDSEPRIDEFAQEVAPCSLDNDDAGNVESPSSTWMVDSPHQLSSVAVGLVGHATMLAPSQGVCPVRLEDVVVGLLDTPLPNGGVMKCHPARMPLIPSTRLSSCGDHLPIASARSFCVSSASRTDSENVGRKRKKSNDNVDMIPTKRARR